ncbi:MAG TPA: PAS domain-containing protein [Candidatus Cybelea sp.]|nr:PAS domain-containing protein [Candidatus Cybelea sp.]
MSAFATEAAVRQPSSVETEGDGVHHNPNIRDPRLARLYDYWCERRGSDAMPRRCDIDPLKFPYVLGNIMLVEVQREPQRFRVRLHGSHMVQRAGYDMTGKWLDELPGPEYRAYVIERCRGLVETRKPLVTVHDRILDGRAWRYEVLWLPFSENGRDADVLLCALIYQDKPLPQTDPLSPA